MILFHLLVCTLINVIYCDNWIRYINPIQLFHKILNNNSNNNNDKFLKHENNEKIETIDQLQNKIYVLTNEIQELKRYNNINKNIIITLKKDKEKLRKTSNDEITLLKETLKNEYNELKVSLLKETEFDLEQSKLKLEDEYSHEKNELISSLNEKHMIEITKLKDELIMITSKYNDSKISLEELKNEYKDKNKECLKVQEDSRRLEELNKKVKLYRCLNFYYYCLIYR